VLPIFNAYVFFFLFSWTFWKVSRLDSKSFPWRTASCRSPSSAFVYTGTSELLSTLFPKAGEPPVYLNRVCPAFHLTKFMIQVRRTVAPSESYDRF
jgi:hypothetical protein